MKAIYLLLLLVGFSIAQVQPFYAVPDTNSLKTMEVGLGSAVYMQGYAAGNVNGAGTYIVIDSAYAEGSYAFDHPTRGYQWYLNQAVSVANNAVDSSKIAAGAVQTSDLADSSITSAKIATGTIAYNNLTSTIKNYVGGGNDFVDVTQYGLLGDNSTDNTATLKAMIANYGDDVVYYFPAGTYITDSIHIENKSHITFLSEQKVVLKLSSSTATGVFDVQNSHHINFKGLVFDGNSANVSGTSKGLIEFTEVDSSDIENCTFKNSDGGGVILNNSWYNDITNCDVFNLRGVGINVGTHSVTDSSSHNNIFSNRISRVGAVGSGAQGIFCNIARYTSGADSIIAEYGFNKFVNNIIEDTYHVGMEIWAANSLVSGNTIRRTGNQTSSGITIGSAPNCEVTDNNISFFTNAGIEASSSSIGSGHVTIKGNTIHHYEGRGIIAGGSLTQSTTIIGNTIDSCYSTGATTGRGIVLGGGEGFTVVQGNTLTRMGGLGIWSTSPNSSIIGNTLDYRDFVGQNGRTSTNAIELSSSGGQIPTNNIVLGNIIVGNDSSSSGYQVYGINYNTQSSGIVSSNIIKDCYVGIYTIADSAIFALNSLQGCATGIRLDNVTRNPNMYAFNLFNNTTKRWNSSTASAYPPQLNEEDIWFGNWGSGADVHENADLFRTRKYSTLPDTSGWSADFNKDGTTFILRTSTADTLMIYDKALKLFHKVGLQ